MINNVAHIQPVEVLLDQKASVIRGIHDESSCGFKALEIETKHGRIVHFVISVEKNSNNELARDLLLPSGKLERVDLTERLPFAFRSDQLVEGVARLQGKTTGGQCADSWQISFSSKDYFVIFAQNGVIEIATNRLPNIY